MLNPKYIINFPTKRHWRGASKIADIESGLDDLVMVVLDKNIQSIAIPPLGCGLGGLSWDDVKQLIEAALGGLEKVTVDVFEPTGAPKATDMVSNSAAPKMTSGRAALICLVRRYLAGLLDPHVSLLEIHKLMYFLQASGEVLRLKYVKGPYGPYAENLTHLLRAIEGNFLSGYADGGDAPSKQISIIPGAYGEAIEFLKSQKETSANIDKVTELVDGFESSFGMELLATVHWVVSNGANTMDAVENSVYKWNRQKQKFSQGQIKIAIDRLVQKNWISMTL